MKRMFDVLVSFSLLFCTIPIIAVLVILVRLKLGPPILFKQQRPGLYGKSFYFNKFRTMTNEKGSDGQLLSDFERLTTFGKFLRKYSLDELPQLINVIKGDMSLVGPRPLLNEYLTLYTTEQSRRHEVVPGITGWAQINGRNNISWDKKFKLDIWYIENQTFLLDLKILWLTIIKVVRTEGVNKQGMATTEYFNGSN